jgi:hypothetical protein
MLQRTLATVGAVLCLSAAAVWMGGADSTAVTADQGPPPAAAAPAALRATDLPLLQKTSLVYQGGFTLPMRTINDTRFGFGGTALAFDPRKGTLFLVGHDWHQKVAEVAIPEIRKSSTVEGYAVATVVQPFFDITDGKAGRVADVPGIALGGQATRIGGLLPWADTLYASAFIYYDANLVQKRSHFVSSRDLSQPADARGPFRVQADKAGYVSGYMAVVPAVWRQLLGGPALTGNCCLSIIDRTSYGPAVFSFDPANIGVVDPVPATPLVYYTREHPLAAYTSSGTDFNGTTLIRGLVFPEGSRSVLFFGTHGTGTWCYGAEQCKDPAGAGQGTHAYPYINKVWAYDAAELAKVKSGQLRPWAVRPYVTWELTLPFEKVGKRLNGAAYDAATGRVFIAQGNGEQPIIHVFQVTLP